MAYSSLCLCLLFNPKGCSNLHPFVVDNEFPSYRLSLVLIKQQRMLDRNRSWAYLAALWRHPWTVISKCCLVYIYIQRQLEFGCVHSYCFFDFLLVILSETVVILYY
ncbi:AQG_2a_G0034130.mRNA.1.CDS.1 [Saccharomyces cerevisiae]|nr:ASG_G0033580.mRNA.1.CDS.1 [Saccharomyces cerevisiae]CAI4601372.1 AAR_G0034010.mRNA.1.CDS.1 [Saccharomyces cerevisiae]CAI4612849.1 ABA_G0034320.mRNA.1.CDS.1 [Saccharomyces cerevisiae]CAI4617450.1 AQG_2a_G0034130.mRNA.1.CDS.1 [Saccharomyces cerevisiae]CAI4631680.1 AGA_1a_G0035490.mRNA.1.CDS.1 [Saccharomyces cerevisiae]